MNVACKDRDRILREQDPAALEALAQHARRCAACHEELRLWSEISEAAPLLRKGWEGPHLWPRIRATLAEESERRQKSPLRLPWEVWVPQWRMAIAAIVLLAVSTVGILQLMKRLEPKSPVERALQQKTEKRLLTEQALSQTEDAEAAYLKSIGKLEQLAAPRVQQATSPLMLSYREKLLVLDAAIAELRTQIERNRYNAHLRREMLSIYQEKQRTLEAVLREE